MSASIHQEQESIIRLQIEQELADLELTKLALKARLNSLTAAARLPPELLSHIFEYCAHDAENCRIPEYNHGRLADLDWIPAATHVCRAWRAAALGCPTLWTRIAPARPEWMVLLLERSRGAPLIVEIEDAAAWGDIGAIAAHIHRAGELHLRFCSGFMLQRAFAALSTSPAPLLRYLSVLERDESCASLPHNVFQGSAPSLRRLLMRTRDFQWDTPLLANLTSIEIHSQTHPSRPPATRALEALRRLPQLEFLSLNNAFTTDSLPAEATGTHRLVQLPRLARLELCDDIRVCTFLLACLRFPSSTSVRLSCDSQMPYGQLDDFAIALETSIIASRGNEPFHSVLVDDYCGSINGLRVRVWADSAVENLFDRTTPPEVDVHLTLRQSLLDFFKQAMVVLYRTLRLSHVDVLHLDLEDPHILTTLDIWNNASITTLGFRGELAAEVFFMLGVRGVDSEDTRNATWENQAIARIFFPRLERLILYALNFTERSMFGLSRAAGLEALIEYMQKRSATGTVLKKLHVINCMPFTEDMQKKVERLVLEVVWDRARDSEGSGDLVDP